ncbi:MAG: aldehyde dehydrogenase family protein [Spirochaetia bacterium]|jgi:succinate-semialdehyde dehydrogenase/glutarate-semialdehyde dehydrogenase|nr:aldehyde dehydrogenase family protein [Spirochaetia bacterium]
MKRILTGALKPSSKKSLDYPVHSVKDIFSMVFNAKRAQKQWEAFPIKTRIQYIRRVGDYIVAHADEIAEVISLDNGKTLTDAMAAEVLPCAAAIDYYCKNAKKFMRDKKIAPGSLLFINKRSLGVRSAYGVIGIISPWNYPFSIPFSEVVMALLAGNAVLLKGASETGAVARLLKRCFEAAAFPEYIFNSVNSPGVITGDAFIDAGVDKLFFTGSVKVGKYLMKQASKKLTPLVLELGGNDPMIVCEDANLERAAAGAVWAGFSNAGQSCGGVERIYVHKSVYDDFLQIIKNKIESLRIGGGDDFNTDIGPLTLERQVKTVNAHVADALKKGARIHAKADVPKGLKGHFLPCLVITGVNHSMLLMKDETFGPVVGVMPYAEIDEAVELANDSNLGLTASVWSKSGKRAAAIARRLRAGAVTINDHLMSHGMAATPWGGFKESGIGRTHGESGFLEMTQSQVIINDIMPLAKRDFWWHPNSKRVYDGLRGALLFFYGKGIGRRLGGLKALLKVFPDTFRRI